MKYRIKSIDIKNFGIFKNRSIELSDFNLFYGKNESGKTTILDAILSSLFKFPDKLFVNRKYRNNEVLIKLDNGNDILELTPKSSTFIDDLGLFGKISQKDYMIFRSLVMRGLDYSIEGENHTNKVFDLIKKNISGFDYNKLRNRILDIVQLTPVTRDFKKDRKENIGNLKNELNNINVIEEKLKSLNEQQKLKPELEAKIAQIEKTKKVIDSILKYIDLKKYKIQQNKVAGIEKQLQNYSYINKDDLFLWEQLEKARYDIDKNLASCANKTEISTFHSEELRKRIKDTSIQIKKISDDLAKYEQFGYNKENYESLTESLNKYSLIFKVSSISTFLLTLFSIFSAIKGNYILTIITAPILIYTILLFLKNKKTTHKIMDILESAEKDGISIHQYEDNVNNLRKNIDKLEKDLKQLNEEREKVENEIEKNKNDVNKLNKKSDENNDQITKLISATHCKDISELRNKLGEKQKLNINFINEENILKQMKAVDKIDNDLPMIKNSLSLIMLDKEYEQMRKTILSLIKSIAISEDINSLSDIVSELNSLNDILNKKLVDKEKLLNEINKLEQAIKMFLNTNNYQNRFEMELREMQILDKLKQYENAKIAAKIAIEAIDRTEKTFTENIGHTINLGKIQEYMKIITGKDNLSVEINGSMEFTIIEDEGEINEAYLSTGTLVQLMFCIRIAIAEKIFNDQKLFFFLDDTLLTFDEERKINAIKLIKKLSDNGWQFFYFTVDKAIIKLFKKEIIKNINEIAL